MPGLGLAGGFGAGAGFDAANELRVLLQRELEADARQKEAEARRLEDARQFNETQPIRLGQLKVSERGADVDEGHLGLARDRFAFQQPLDLADAQREAERHGWHGVTFRNTQDDRARVRSIVSSLPAGPNQQAIDLTSLGVNVSPDALMTPEQIGQRKATEAGTMWDQAGRRIFTDQQRIDAQNRPAPTTSEPLVAVINSEGQEELVPRSQAAGRRPASTRKPVIGQEKTALAFYQRMTEALDNMNAIEDSLSQKDLYIINNAPGPQVIKNALLSDAGRRYAAALNSYTEARLRKESGAAIPVSEYQSDRQTIARQVGDDPGTIAQKRSMRENTAEGIGFASGRAYEEYYGKPFPKGERQSVGGNTDQKSVTQAELAAIARSRGTTVEQERQRATAAGYVIR